MKVDVVDVFLILFSVFIGYQLALKMFTGSVELDILIISLLMFNIIVTWKMGRGFSDRMSAL
ncbi:hypothetical protein HN451_03225 [archaeon]|jgi:hypothetical protein|nr:hypothetical protein [archaeon]